MKLFLYALLCTSVVLASPFGEGKGRIVGGFDARAGEFPSTVAIYLTRNGGTYFCGGSILNHDWIITSAQCVQDVTSFVIHIASYTLDGSGALKPLNISTDTYVAHPDYNPDTIENDIGLIKSRLPIIYNDYVFPISLPTRDLQPYAIVTAVGWGSTSDSSSGLSNTLQQVVLTAISNEECRLTYSDVILDKMVCVDGNLNEGACRGDSGGPLVQYVNAYSAVLVGVSSFISTRGCESTDPSGYTRIFPYLDWIEETMLSTQ